MLKYIEKFIDNPWVNLLSGLVLLYTSGIEVFDSLDDDFKMGAHHGVLVFGLLQLLRSLPEFVEGSKRIRESQRNKDKLKKSDKK